MSLLKSHSWGNSAFKPSTQNIWIWPDLCLGMESTEVNEMVRYGCPQWLSQVCLQAFKATEVITFPLKKSAHCTLQHTGNGNWCKLVIFSNVSRHAGHSLVQLWWVYRNCVSGCKYLELSGSATMTRPSGWLGSMKLIFALSTSSKGPKAIASKES